MRSDQRAQRKPMMSNEIDGLTGMTLNGPAAGPRRNSPPRVSTLGSPVSAAPSRQVKSVVLMAGVQGVHPPVGGATQSATYSWTLPTMSNAPADDTQALRDPVGTAIELRVLQSFVRSSGPGSGAPATA